jgi:RimJ/RimL family protein N-acetyltransferase
MAEAAAIVTARLRLVPFAARHLSDRYVGWLNDAGVLRYSENRHRRHDLDSCRRYYDGMLAGPGFFWAIEIGDTGEHVGNLTASIDVPNRVADLGILLGERAAWGQGFGAEAWIGALRHLLGPAGLRKVEGGAMAENAAMIAIFHRAGMHREGLRRGHFLLDGRAVDMALYGLAAGQAPPSPADKSG